MKRACMIALALALATGARAGPAPPDAVVRAIYAADAPFIKGTGEGIMGDKKAKATFFSAALLRMIVADEKRSAKLNQPPNLDGDPFVDAQEATVSDLKISLVSADQTKASVLADFDRGEGKREKVTYSMTLERGLWRVDDIAYDLPGEPPRTLRGELTEK
jgi:hypothetical protein